LVREFQNKFSHVIAGPFLADAPLEHNNAKLCNPPIVPSQQVNPKFKHPPADPNLVENINDSGPQVDLISTTDHMCAIVHSPAGDLHTPNVEWNLASTPWIWDRMVNIQPGFQKQSRPQLQLPPQPQPQSHGHATAATRGVAVLESRYQHHLLQNRDNFAASHIPQSNLSLGVNSDCDPSGMSNHRDPHTGLLGHVTQLRLPVVSNTIDCADHPSQPESP
jgi:hypothetical protein